MDLRSLFEDEESDRASRLQAVILHTQISHWLESNKEVLSRRLRRVDGNLEGSFLLTSEMVDMDEYYPDLLIVFTPKRIVKAKDGSHYQTGGGFFVNGGKSVIMVAALKAPGDVSDLPSRFRVGAKSSFIHEFMHYLMRSRSREAGSVDSLLNGGESDYFNNADETNAYYQEAAQNVVELTNSLREFPRYIDKLDAMSVPQLVSWYKARCFNKDFLAHASPKTIRALDKRLARLISTTIKPMIVKAKISP